MKFTAIGKTLGDVTTPYSVTDYNAKTVVEFVNEVLERRREWGEIAVHGLGRVEYRYGELLDTVPDAWQYRGIGSVNACGGWSRMDYLIIVGAL